MVRIQLGGLAEKLELLSIFLDLSESEPYFFQKIGETRSWNFLSAGEKNIPDDKRHKTPMKDVVLILHNIRSTHNVGSLFRSADCAGIKKLYLVGYTPDPIDRFGRVQKDIAKIALGGEKSVSWEHVSEIEPLIKTLKQKNYKVIAIEQDQKAVDYKKVKCPSKVAFILGNEVSGIPKEILKLCDLVAEIPMKGEKESLNVSVAGAVAIFRILKI